MVEYHDVEICCTICCTTDPQQIEGMEFGVWALGSEQQDPL